MGYQNKILTTTGCYGTGSSAVTDFIREFDSVACKSDYEVRFIHDPDGISDLEYHLIENPNRHNSSNSIKRFIRMMEDLDHVWFIKRYAKHLGGGFLKLVYEYVDRITVLQYAGSWHQDVYDRGKLFFVLSRLSSHFSTFLHQYFHCSNLKSRSLLPVGEKAFLPAVREEVFLNGTRDFIDHVASLANTDAKSAVLLDQLVPPSNFRRYIRYFHYIKIILVERDPRDLYILEKYIWHGRVVPYQRIEVFCKWYQWTRQLYRAKPFPEEVLFIQFEDFIYNYEETSEKIIRHFKLDPKTHTKKQKYFQPGRSKNNTHLWTGYPAEKRNIAYIEQALSEYCYCFPANIEYNEYNKKGVF